MEIINPKHKMRELLLTKEDVKRYDEDGVIIIKDAFNKDWVDKIKEGIEVTDLGCPYWEKIQDKTPYINLKYAIARLR